jgi:hypothetical protein
MKAIQLLIGNELIFWGQKDEAGRSLPQLTGRLLWFSSVAEFFKIS